MSRLFESIGNSKLFDASDLLGKRGFSLHGQSASDAQFPLTWTLSSIGSKNLAEMNLTPNLKSLYGFNHPILDRTVNVNVSYDPETKVIIKDTKLCEHFSLKNESVVGGEMLQSASGHWRYNFQTAKNGDGRVDLDLITPLDKTIAEKSNLQARACFRDFFAAAEITLDQPKEPNLRFGYHSKNLDLHYAKDFGQAWTFEATKHVDANTLVGFSTNLKSGNYIAAIEHVNCDNTEFKINVSNDDVVNFEYGKQFNDVRAHVVAQTCGLLKGNFADTKFGLGVDISL